MVTGFLLARVLRLVLIAEVSAYQAAAFAERALRTPCVAFAPAASLILVR